MAIYRGGMRVGVLLLPTDPWPDAVQRVRQLEGLGYDHVWTYDHLSWRRYRNGPWFAAIPWLTGLAMATSRVELGTMVSSPNVYNPVTLAKDVLTLDHISGGRAVLGLGAGRGAGFDAEVFGRPLPSPAHRVARLAEFVEVLDALLCQGELSYEGSFYTVNEAVAHPRCLQEPRVPFAIAAGGAKTLALAARFGQAWVTYGDASHQDMTPAGTERAVRGQVARLEEECAAVGRDPAELRRIYLIGNTDERPLVSVEAFLEFAARYAALGFTDLVFHHPRPGDPVWTEPVEIVDALAAEALPHLRRLAT